MNNKKRLVYVDIAKGIGVFLMIIGHLGKVCPDFVHAWIYSFHMPLFFFCSGIFAKKNQTIDDTMKCLVRKFKGLFVPYCVYSLGFLFFDNIIGYNNASWSAFENIVKGYDPFNFLWFLYVLFFISVLFCLISFCGVSDEVFSLICFSFALLGFLFNYLGIVERLGSILFCFGFYYCGYYYKRLNNVKRINEYYNKKTLFITIIMSVLGTIVLVSLSRNDRLSIDLHHNIYPDILLTYAIAMCGIFITFYASRAAEDNKFISSIFSIIGRESLIIYPIFTYLPKRLEYLFGTNDAYIKIVTKVCAAIICAFIILIKENRKYFSFICRLKKVNAIQLMHKAYDKEDK